MGILRKVGIGVGIAFGVLIAIVIAVGVATVHNIQEQEKPVSQPTIEESNNQKGKEQEQKGSIAEAKEFSMGETPVVAGVAFQITSAGVSEGNSYSKPDGIFVVLGVTIENLREKTAHVSYDQFTIIDSKGKQYESTYKIFLGSGQILADDIQPNLPTKRNVVFDIPLAEDSEYKVMIKPPLFTLSTDKAVVKLGTGNQIKRGLTV